MLWLRGQSPSPGFLDDHATEVNGYEAPSISEVPSNLRLPGARQANSCNKYGISQCHDAGLAKTSGSERWSRLRSLSSGRHSGSIARSNRTSAIDRQMSRGGSADGVSA